MKLSMDFYSRNTEKVAKEMLGKILVHKTGGTVLKGRIVETEAYFGDKDPASHACMKRTKRNYLMFGEPGRAYVYFCYGNHWLFNVVAKAGRCPGAVLVRALEPLEGLESMKRSRGLTDLAKLANGPGKLTQAMGIGKNHNGMDLTGDEIFLEDSKEVVKIARSRRIGISKGKSKLLRFCIRGSTFVSTGM